MSINMRIDVASNPTPFVCLMLKVNSRVYESSYALV
jgi:hypothetical protein